MVFTHQAALDFDRQFLSAATAVEFDEKVIKRTSQTGGEIHLFNKILPSKTYNQVLRKRVYTQVRLSSEPSCTQHAQHSPTQVHFTFTLVVEL